LTVGASFEYSLEGQSGGQPKENQDSTLVLEVSEFAAAYGVFDGHGAAGAAVSQFVVEHLRGSVDDKMRAQVGGNGRMVPGGASLLKAGMKSIFLSCEKALVTELEALSGLEFDGSTGTLVLRVEDRLICGWVGDTRAIVGNERSEVTELTTDHVPMLPPERQRIEANGGMVAAFPDEPPPEVTGKGRVFIQDQMFPGLAVSRAFGDLVAKRAGVVAEPEVKDVAIASDDMVLIIASDGVWDVVTSEEAVAMCLVHAESRDAILAASDIVLHARQQWEAIQAEAAAEGLDASMFSIDDISCVAVFLQ